MSVMTFGAGEGISAPIYQQKPLYLGVTRVRTQTIVSATYEGKFKLSPLVVF